MFEHMETLGLLRMPVLPHPQPHKLDANGIARHLMEAIAVGHFPVGSLLPTEFELCDHYRASRYAIRAALNGLQQAGLVSRRKNVGTRVEATRPTQTFRPTLASVDDLVQFGERNTRSIRDVQLKVLGSALAKEVGCAPGTRWLQISSLRSVEGCAMTPVGWTDVYIAPAYSDIVEFARASPGTLISTLLATHHGRHIAEIRQDIRAVTLDDLVMCSTLRVTPGSAALRVVRRYYDVSHDLFEASVSVHPADRFAVSMRLHGSAATHGKAA